jgi:hypothetical protein
MIVLVNAFIYAIHTPLKLNMFKKYGFDQYSSVLQLIINFYNLTRNSSYLCL